MAADQGKKGNGTGKTGRIEAKKPSRPQPLPTAHVEEPKPLTAEATPPPVPQRPLASTLLKNIQQLKDLVADSDDIILREVRLGVNQEFTGLLVFVDGLVDKDLINEHILKPLLLEQRMTPLKTGAKVYPKSDLAGENANKEAPLPPTQVEGRASAGENTRNPEEFFALIRDAELSAGDLAETEDLDQLVLAVLSGETAFLLDGVARALIISTRGWEHRTVQEPETQTLIRGPREGFTETLRVNTALLRRRIRDPNLKLRTTRVGRRTKTDVCLAYIQGITNPKLVEEVKKRLECIDVDMIMESGSIEQYIEDSWTSPFPQLQETERPDQVAMALLAGRVAILVDNTPFALLVPVTMNDFFLSPEDYYERWIIGSLVRLVRFTATILALLLPPLYVAIISFHPGMIPSKLALTVAAAREGVPFPSFVEAVIMIIAMELLREAGIRLPGPIGQTIGIVGGLIIGQAAVQAGIVSPLMIIVIAATAVSSFAIPNYGMAIAFRMLILPLMVLAATLGLYGVVVGMLAILTHLVALKSFGVPYLTPFTPFAARDLRDTIYRHTLLGMHWRPEHLKALDPTRMQDRRPDQELASKEKEVSIQGTRPPQLEGEEGSP